MAVDAFFIAWFAVECLLYTFHLSILLLLVVKRRSKFKGAFYNIFRIVVVADFVTFLITVIVSRVSQISYFTPFYTSNTWFSTFITLLTPFISTIQFFGRMLMAFNRFTAVWILFNYQKLWKKQWYTLLTIFVAFLSICWRLHEPMRYVKMPNGNISGSFGNPNMLSIIRVVSLIVLYFTTITAAIFNGLSFAKFCYRKTKSANYTLNEQNLLFMSIIIFIAQFLRASLYLIPTSEIVTAILAIIIPILNDALALSGTLSFLILSKIARNEYLLFYFNKKSNTVVQSSTPNITPISPSIT